MRRIGGLFEEALKRELAAALDERERLYLEAERAEIARRQRAYRLRLPKSAPVEPVTDENPEAQGETPCVRSRFSILEID